MVTALKRLYLRFAPKNVLDPDDINHWKEKVFYTFIFVSLFLILIMGALNFPALIKQNYWAVINTIATTYLACWIIFLFPAMSFTIRVTIASFFVYAVGVSIIYSVGPFLSPREWLLFFSIMASILLGWPGAIISILVNTATFAGIGVLIKTGFWKDHLITDNPLFFWLQNYTDLLFINICTTLFVTFLFQKIEKSDHETKKSSKLMLRQQVKLMDSKNKLEKEFKERKQADKEKIKAQKIAGEQKKLVLVGQVAGKIAHDFNNILGIVMGNTELALLDCKDPQIRKTLELIFEQTLRGKNLTKNLVAFAKDHEPKQNLFKINEKIDLVINLMKKDLKETEMITEKSSGMPDLLADPGMIEHALVNLVQNSIHATSMVEQPRIVIKTFHQEKNIHIEIVDNGCGIPEDAIDRIYEPAFTMKGRRDVTGSYKPGIKGTGYGMANVKKYIKQHKGNILIDSKAGKGTKITISLPVIKKELTEKEIKEIQKGKVSFEKHILLVEDEQAISNVQYKILTHEPCNHNVDIAANGPMAINLFMKNKYDFVSLDYILPGDLNGLDVYKHIRQTNDTIPILFVSGNLDFLESIKKLKHKDPWVDHISKPCQNKDYVSAINELLWDK